MRLKETMKSLIFKYSKGVRQGCPLSPVLFNLYINGIFDLINDNSTSDVYLKENNKVNGLMYADDLVLISKTKEDLQHQIDKLGDFCQKWKLTINIKKNKSMVFNKETTSLIPRLKLGDSL